MRRCIGNSILAYLDLMPLRDCTVLGSQIMIDDTHVDVLCGQGGGVVAGRDVSGLGESSR